MTQQAVAEAKKYVERSLKAQEQLGYKSPRRPVVKAAVAEAALAFGALLALGSKHRNGR